MSSLHLVRLAGEARGFMQSRSCGVSSAAQISRVAKTHGSQSRPRPS